MTVPGAACGAPQAPAPRRLRFLMLNWRDPQNPLAGGAERVSLAFLRGLVERGHEVEWFSFAFPGGAPTAVIDGIRVHRAGGVGSAIWEAFRWYRRQPRFDLVIDQHHGLPWFAPWWCRTHCLAYIHEVLGPIWGSFYRWPISWLGPLQERWVQWLYRGQIFWVPSQSTKRALARHGVERVAVFDNGVDVEPLPSLPPKRPGDPLRLISVSRLAPNKRVDHAVRCVDLLRRGGRSVELVVVGDGVDAVRVRGLVEQLGLGEVVRFVGYLSEREKLEALQRSDILLHPSVREGWGLNVIEANAMGTPAVVYPVDGLVDSTVHGETGYVCRGEDPVEMAAGVEWMVGEEGRYGRVREAAWRWAGRFRWGAVISPVCGFLEELAVGGKMV